MLTTPRKADPFELDGLRTMTNLFVSVRKLMLCSVRILMAFEWQAPARLRVWKTGIGALTGGLPGEYKVDFRSSDV